MGRMCRDKDGKDSKDGKDGKKKKKKDENGAENGSNEGDDDDDDAGDDEDEEDEVSSRNRCSTVAWLALQKDEWLRPKQHQQRTYGLCIMGSHLLPSENTAADMYPCLSCHEGESQGQCS